DHSLVHFAAGAKNFIQWIGGNCADVRQWGLKERIRRCRMGGAKLPHLVVEKPDRGGQVLESAFTFDVHEEHSGAVEEEMIMQGGDVQAAFQGHEHRKINFVLE